MRSARDVLFNPSKMHKSRVLIVEPDHWRHRGIAAELEESGTMTVVGEFDFAEVLTREDKDDEYRPDVVLFAHRLVVEYGIALVAQMKHVFSCPVLVLGDHDSLEVAAEVMAAGGAGYFEMTSPPAYLLNAISVTRKNKLWGSREAIQRMAQLRMDGTVGENGRERLSDSELTILRMLQEGLANKEIAQRLGVAEVTIKSRLTKLYKRFGVTTRLQLLSAALKKGFLGNATEESSGR